MGNAVLEYRPQRRAASLLFVERTIRRFSPAILPAEPYSSGRYCQHKACQNKNQAKTARGQSCPPAQISIALLPLPAVSFLGGFQTPAGPEKTRAHPSGRHLKPITRRDIGPISESACCWRLSCRSGPTLALEAPLSLLHICFSDRLPGARSALKCKTVPLRGTGARRFLNLFRDGLPLDGLTRDRRARLYSLGPWSPAKFEARIEIYGSRELLQNRPHHPQASLSRPLSRVRALSSRVKANQEAAGPISKPMRPGNHPGDRYPGGIAPCRPASPSP